jgi:hypothetical protein
MTLLVSVAEAKDRLRITTDAEDADIESLIHGASAAVMNYLHVDETAFMVPADSDSEYADTSSSSSGSSSSEGSSSDYASSSDMVLAVPPEVQLAVLVLTGNYYRDREAVDAKDWEHGYLPKPVLALLYPLRDPALG